MISKSCLKCGKEFLDNTKSHNKKYCSAKCRDSEENKRAKNRQKLWRLSHKPLIRKTMLGTITYNMIDKRINQLMRLNKC